MSIGGVTLSSAEPRRAALRILIVDDDAPTRRLIATALTAEGYRVRDAAGGREAIELARRDPPHLILLDVNMPLVDGWQVLEELRATAGPQTPVVVMTAGFAAQDRALTGGAQGYLAKPFDLDELLSTVEAHAGLRLRGGTEEPITPDRGNEEPGTGRRE
jgi:DNA-binding response OmpR family regulator